MRSMADIRHSIRAVEDTQQITKAMNLISTSKMRKAIKLQEANAVYFDRVRATVKDILTHSPDLTHKYLGKSEGGSAAYVVIAADKGLCGGYNHNVLNFAVEYMSNSREKYIITVGQECRAFFEKRGYDIDVEFLNISQNPSLKNATDIGMDILGLYDSGLMDEVYIIYTHFYNTMVQKPAVIKLLPLEMKTLADIETDTQYSAAMNYYPSSEAVLNDLVPQCIFGLVYGCLVQSYASEQCERMLAMDNATKNAQEMIARYTLDYNRARQSAVTSEIAEIIGALEVL